MVEYILGKSGSGKYQQLACAEDSDALVRDLAIYGFGDCLGFYKKGNGCLYGSEWGLRNLGCFKELGSFHRLESMPKIGIERLSARIYELLFMGTDDEEHYKIEPKFDRNDPKYLQILEELSKLKETESILVASGKIVYPGISQEEMDWKDLW